MALKLTDAEKKRRDAVAKEEQQKRQLEASSQKTRQEAAGSTGSVLIGGKAATPEDLERVNKKALAKQQSDAAIQQERQQRVDVALGPTELETRQAAAAETIDGAGTIEETTPTETITGTGTEVAETEQQTENLGIAGTDIYQEIDGIKKLIIPEGSPITQQQAAILGLTEDSPEVQTANLVSSGVALGAAATLGVTGVGSLTSTAGNFLSKFLTSGKIAGATQATGVLTAPTKIAASSSSLKTAAITILGFSGLGSAKSIATNVLTSKVKNIETETGKLGEQITKIPETSNLGFSINEDGELYEYTPEKALVELEGLEQTLIELETALQTASIGQTVLKITGKYQSAQGEIDKQRREITSARAKILSQLANPPEALLNSRDFFRGFELAE